MAEGKIVKSLSGFYYVSRDEDKTIYQCRGRGNFRKRKITPLVGDHVVFESSNETDGYILEIRERRNELVRPPIANVDQALTIFSLKEPDLNLQLLDKFLVHLEASDITPIICFTKTDLLSREELEHARKMQAQYELIGYVTILISVINREGIDGVYSSLRDKVTVVAGQSGVGKSSLLNALDPTLQLKTGQISSHLGRGRHTTRHVELLPIAGGLVADTPGFSSLDFYHIDEEALSLFFPEMRQLLKECKFRRCTHMQEPGCAVTHAVKKGEMAKSRYNHYKLFYEEIKQRRRY